TADAKKTLPAQYLFTTGSGADNGVHTFAATLRTASPTQSLIVADTVKTSITGSAAVQVDPAAARKFAVTLYPSPVNAGSTNTFTVTAQDIYGNTTPAYGGTVGFSSSDSNAQFSAA